MCVCVREYMCMFYYWINKSKGKSLNRTMEKQFSSRFLAKIFKFNSLFDYLQFNIKQRNKLPRNLRAFRNLLIGFAEIYETLSHSRDSLRMCNLLLHCSEFSDYNWYPFQYILKMEIVSIPETDNGISNKDFRVQWK